MNGNTISAVPAPHDIVFRAEGLLRFDCNSTAFWSPTRGALMFTVACTCFHPAAYQLDDADDAMRAVAEHHYAHTLQISQLMAATAPAAPAPVDEAPVPAGRGGATPGRHR